MIIAAKSKDEEKRLQALRDLLILDTPPEERFDRITQFARFEFDVSIVVISLVDEERQWFKSIVGLDACSTSRDIAFCAHAILQDNIMVVEDALKDERFFDNPLVIGEPYIRFYAGAPLTLPTGEKIGTLCLIDQKPNSLNKLELSILSTLRQMVISELLAVIEKCPKG
jgi:GAF domain-containing protein